MKFALRFSAAAFFVVSLDIVPRLMIQIVLG